MQSFEKLEKVPNMIQLIMGIVVATITMDLRDFDAMKRTMDDTGPIDLLLLNHNVFVLSLFKLFLCCPFKMASLVLIFRIVIQFLKS